MSNATKKKMLAMGVSPLQLARYRVVSCADGSEQGYFTELYINSPDMGALSPMRYQVIADMSNQGLRLAACALRRVADYLAADAGRKRWVSFYLPARGLMFNHLKRMLKSERNNERYDLSRLVIEVPSDILYEDAAQISETMRELKREYGVRFLLSGYCDEYCPILRLPRFPFDFVLLDFSVDTSAELKKMAGAVRLAKQNGGAVVARIRGPLLGLLPEEMPDMTVLPDPMPEGGET